MLEKEKQVFFSVWKKKKKKSLLIRVLEWIYSYKSNPWIN